MKIVEKTKRSGTASNKTAGPGTAPRKGIDSRDLNTPSDQATNAPVDENTTNQTDNRSRGAVEDTTVEEEQDREVVRKMEDAHPDEIMK